MEADSCVETLKVVNQSGQGVRIGVIIGDIFYLRQERVTRKMTIIVSNVSVCYTFFRERNNGRIRS